MGETVNWSDQRNALRQRTLKRGRAMVNDVEVAEVTVRNMSLTGARIISPDCENLPESFTLKIGEEGLTREVEVRSRSATGLGVRFLKPLSTEEFGAEFLQAKTTEAREKTVAEQRAELVQRARDGLERMDLGFVAPPLEMPDPAAAEGNDDSVTSEAGEPDIEKTDVVSADLDDEGNEPEELEADPAATTEIEDAADEPIPAFDDGLGEGTLARTGRSHPPRAIRRLLPWGVGAQ